MTTGRINQVTILNPSATPGEFAPGSPRGGGALLRGLGSTEVNPAGRAACARRRATPDDHPIAPTEFPKGRSAAGQSGRGPPYQAACAPQEEGYHRQSTPWGGYWQRRPPESVVKQWPVANHPQTPKICPLSRRPAGLQSPTA